MRSINLLTYLLVVGWFCQ